MDERRLILGLKRGESRCYELLFNMYYAKFCNFAEAIIRDWSAAKDLVQEAFIRVWNSKDRLDEDKSIENYLFVIVKRLILNYIRDHKPRKDLSFDGTSSDGIPVTAPDVVENIVIADETKRKIQGVVSRMPLQRRTVYIMSRDKGMSNKEISEALGISVRTVDRHISMALADIRKTLS